MDDPYEILGVERTATLAKIKRAYRDKAKKAHPDAGGSDAAMAALSRAFMVLSDSERRKKFDETGSVDVEPDNLTTAAINNITAMINTFLMHDREIPDYKRAMIARFEAKKIEVRKSLMPAERAINRAERIKKRWKRKKRSGEDLLSRAIDWQIDRHKEVIAKGEGDIRILDRCIEILNGYTYSTDAASTLNASACFTGVNF